MRVFISSDFVRIYMNLFKIKQSVRILFGLCELCEFIQILYTVRILFGLCELCEKLF